MGHLPKQIHTALVAVCHYLKTSKVNFTFIQHKETQGKEEKYLLGQFAFLGLRPKW